MRATLAILLGIASVAMLVFVGAQLGQPEASPAPTAASNAPSSTGAPPAPPPEGYFEQESGKVSPTQTLEYDWSRVEIRATIPGVHFNINQPARRYDSSADDWSLVFHLNAPFQDTDYVSFCGPASTVTIQVRDNGDQKPTIYEATLNEVPPCT